MLTRRRTPATTLLLATAAAAAAAALLSITTAHAFVLPAKTTLTRWGAPATTTTSSSGSSRQRTIHASSASSSSTESGSVGVDPPARKYTTRFDPEKGARLASFSFAVYGNPSGSRFFRTKDGSDVGFHDDEVVRKNFQYLMFAHVIRAKNLPQEANLVDRVLQGGSADPDPFAIVEVLSSHGEDIAITKAAESSRNPEFYNARYFLYVDDLETATLKLTLKDKNNVGGDDLIGSTTVPLSELFKDGGQGQEDKPKWSGWMDIKSPTGKPRGSVELAFELIPLEPLTSDFGETNDGEGDEDGDGGRSVPSSLSEGIDWEALATKIRGGTVGGLGKYALGVFLNNEATDTQGAVWLNKKNKEMVLCFRGTEIAWKDLLTDALIIQQPLDGTKQDKRLVHAGFRRAFRSIREAVYTALYFITHNDMSGWSIDVCGHSLGGALATLVAHDLATKFPELAASGRLQMYSYGAPRVGNTAFRDDYDAKLGDTSFRIVNNQDIVARVPRATRSPSLIEYDHVGRTCLISFTDDGDLNVFIEGESPGVCPLRAVDRGGKADIQEAQAAREAKRAAILNKIAETDLSQILSGPVQAATFRNGSSASIGDMLKLASNFSTLGAMMQAPPVGAFGKLSLKMDLGEMKHKIGDAVKGVTDPNKVKDMALSTVGLDATFVDAELKLMESIVKGDGFADHREGKYYSSMERAFMWLADAKNIKKEGKKKG